MQTTLDPFFGNEAVEEVFNVSVVNTTDFGIITSCDKQNISSNYWVYDYPTRNLVCRQNEEGYVKITLPSWFDIVSNFRVTGAVPGTQLRMEAHFGTIGTATVDNDGCAALSLRLFRKWAKYANVYIIGKGPELRITFTVTFIKPSLMDHALRNFFTRTVTDIEVAVTDIQVDNECVYKFFYCGGLLGVGKKSAVSWLRTRELTGRTKF